MRLHSLLPALGALSLSSLGGCIIYEKDVIHHDDGGGECGRGEPCDDWGWYEGEGDSAEDPGDVDPETLWFFAPNTLAPGETKILSLTSDPIYDYLSITEVALYGDASVCAIDVREDEVLVTASAFQDAAEGTVNALIVTEDGEGIWVPDALSIVGAGSSSGDGSGGGAGGETGGGGSGGETGGGSGGDAGGSSGGASSGGCG